MPIQDGPFIMKDTLGDPHNVIDQPMPVGLIREFTVGSYSLPISTSTPNPSSSISPCCQA